MTKTLSNTQEQQLHVLYEQMRPQHLYPLWEVLHDLVIPEPATRAVPAIWHYADARTHLMRAGDLISAEQAERRVLIMENPGLPGEHAITPRLYAGLQLVLPGEIAPCHRHSQSALRFVMEGSGAYTAVDGERAFMERFDLILTPNWHWHDHGNPSSEAVIWLDGLDIPTVRSMDAQFAERSSDEWQPETVPSGTTQKIVGRSLRRRGPSPDRSGKRQKLIHYPYAEWRKSLQAAAQAEEPDPDLGHALEFIDPATGGAVMSTLSAEVRMLPAGFETRRRRSTESAVFTVVEGSGEFEVDGQVFKLAELDVVAVPSWKATRWRATQNLVLFAFSDRTIQEKLGLYREASE